MQNLNLEFQGQVIIHIFNTKTAMLNRLHKLCNILSIKYCVITGTSLAHCLKIFLH